MTALKKTVKTEILIMVSKLVRSIGQKFTDIESNPYEIVDVIKLKGMNYCVVENLNKSGSDRFEVLPVRYVYDRLG
jgi:hypothetical protein